MALNLEGIPNEILLQIVSDLDPAEKLNLAVAKPELFLYERLDIIELDTTHQRRLQELERQPADRTEKDRPLLNAAIENGADMAIVQRIVGSYLRQTPSAVDGVWGEFPTGHPPPIHAAASAGRSDVVNYLLGLHADPRREFVDPASGKATNALSHAVQSVAKTRDLPGPKASTPAVEAASTQRCRAIEDCALAIFGRYQGSVSLIVNAERLDELLLDIIVAGLSRLLALMGNSILAQPQGIEEGLKKV
ncbi:hypothetical protein F4778DRAFT_798228 [Xylariomycetidae sp. FL2044]|nr:hypothetical protein F4778DRAFT_798228 [Xylariomycetidae sp. FL2044]